MLYTEIEKRVITAIANRPWFTHLYSKLFPSTGELSSIIHFTDAEGRDKLFDIISSSVELASKKHFNVSVLVDVIGSVLAIASTELPNGEADLIDLLYNMFNQWHCYVKEGDGIPKDTFTKVYSEESWYIVVLILESLPNNPDYKLIAKI